MVLGRFAIPLSLYISKNCPGAPSRESRGSIKMQGYRDEAYFASSMDWMMAQTRSVSQSARLSPLTAKLMP